MTRARSVVGCSRREFVRRAAALTVVSPAIISGSAFGSPPPKPTMADPAKPGPVPYCKPYFTKNDRRFPVRYHEFAERPLSDSCWSVQTGPDGRVYIACCVEHTGGQTVTVVRYDPVGDRLEYLFDMDQVTGDLRDSGRATQCKIHHGFAPDAERGLLYAATHLRYPDENNYPAIPP